MIGPSSLHPAPKSTPVSPSRNRGGPSSAPQPTAKLLAPLSVSPAANDKGIVTVNMVERPQPGAPTPERQSLRLRRDWVEDSALSSHAVVAPTNSKAEKADSRTPDQMSPDAWPHYPKITESGMRALQCLHDTETSSSAASPIPVQTVLDAMLAADTLDMLPALRAGKGHLLKHAGPDTAKAVSLRAEDHLHSHTPMSFLLAKMMPDINRAAMHGGLAHGDAEAALGDTIRHGSMDAFNILKDRMDQDFGPTLQRLGNDVAWAASLPHVPVCKAVLEHGGDPAHVLRGASECDHAELIGHALPKCPPLPENAHLEQRALYSEILANAAQRNNHDLTRAMINLGAQDSRRGDRSALAKAARGGDAAMLRMILDTYPDPRRVPPETRSAAYDGALEQEDRANLRILLDRFQSSLDEIPGMASTLIKHWQFRKADALIQETLERNPDQATRQALESLRESPNMVQGVRRSNAAPDPRTEEGRLRANRLGDFQSEALLAEARRIQRNVTKSLLQVPGQHLSLGDGHQLGLALAHEPDWELAGLLLKHGEDAGALSRFTPREAVESGNRDMLDALLRHRENSPEEIKDALRAARQAGDHATIRQLAEKAGKPYAWIRFKEFFK